MGCSNLSSCFVRPESNQPQLEWAWAWENFKPRVNNPAVSIVGIGSHQAAALAGAGNAFLSNAITAKIGIDCARNLIRRNVCCADAAGDAVRGLHFARRNGKTWHQYGTRKLLCTVYYRVTLLAPLLHLSTAAAAGAVVVAAVLDNAGCVLPVVVLMRSRGRAAAICPEDDVMRHYLFYDIIACLPTYLPTDLPNWASEFHFHITSNMEHLYHFLQLFCSLCLFWWASSWLLSLLLFCTLLTWLVTDVAQSW